MIRAKPGAVSRGSPSWWACRGAPTTGAWRATVAATRRRGRGRRRWWTASNRRWRNTPRSGIRRGLPQDRCDRRRGWPPGRFSVERETGDGAPRAAATRALSGRTPPARRRAPGGLRGPAGAPQPRLAGGLLNVRDHQRRHLAALRRRRLRRQDRPGVAPSRPPRAPPTSSPPCRAPSRPPRRCWAVASSRTASIPSPARSSPSWL